MYIDGGWQETVPLTPFLAQKSQDVRALAVSAVKDVPITDIKSFTITLARGYIKNLPRYNNFTTTTIPLEGVDIFDFKMKDTDKLALFVRGFNFLEV